MTIFVQIASYRDPELIPTLQDCLEKAENPNELTFGICRQFDPADKFDNLDHLQNNSKFRIIDIPCHESGGMCWAREKIQKLYDNETYTLQLDSHHRFAKNWDTHLINQLLSAPSDKPLITGYLGGYNHLTKNDFYYPYPATQIIARRFAPPGTISFGNRLLDTEHNHIPARFVSGHFFFTLGKHCVEYKYDPHLYFAGDEISLSIRSYTLGYDLFHPKEFVIWHNYQTYERPKHWQDHDDTKTKTEKNWYSRDTFSKQRIRQLLKEEDYNIDLGIYGLGSVRTHRDYEDYAGLDFKSRKIHPNTLTGSIPPTCNDKSWTESLYQTNLDFRNMLDNLTTKSNHYNVQLKCNEEILYDKLYNISDIEGNSYWDWLSCQTNKIPSHLILQALNDQQHVLNEIIIDA